jgi:hypothetical protein
MQQNICRTCTNKMRFALAFACCVIGFGLTAQKNPSSSATKITLEAPLNALMDAWHKHATLAKFDEYFAETTENFVFYGTAPGEKWDKEAFKTFCKPYFDSTRTWRFTPSNRVWNFSKDGKIAWFDEDLQTWMLDCRGSGVCEKTKKGWKLAYYNLSVVIENEKIQEFIKLRKD